MSFAGIHANNFDRVADVYDATRGFPVEVSKDVGANLATVLRGAHARRILEVGIGTGRIAVPLAEEGFQVTGIDISMEMMRRLREKRQDIALVLADAARPPFRAGSFDAVLFAHVLHLVPDPAGALNAAMECVRKGGSILNCHHTYGRYAADRAGTRLTEIVTEVTGSGGRIGNRRYRTDGLFNEVLSEAGATFQTFEAAAWTEVTTARREIENLQNRVNSNTWAIPDDALPEVVRRFAPEAEAIYGGLDTPAEAPVTFTVTMACLPG